MGPRSFNRGNSLCMARWSIASSCFNGAAVFQPRKWDGWSATRPGCQELQWGRGLSTAEIGSGGRTGRSAARRRLQWGRGLSTAEIADVRERSIALVDAGFNGAAVFQPRKSAAHRVRLPSSSQRFNGAAVFQPRKSPTVPVIRWLKVRLQWGRGLSTAEISFRAGTGRRVAASFNGAAVFQPRKWARLDPASGT